MALRALPVLAEPRTLLTGHVPTAIATAPLIDHLSGTHRLRLAIALPARDEAGLATFLRDLYDPANPNYRQYLTPAQFAERFGSSPAAYQAVVEYAQTNGLTVIERHLNRLVLDVEGNVSDIERTFQVTLGVYDHPTEGRQFFAPGTEPSIAAGVPICGLSGLDNFALPQPHLHVRTADQTSRPNATTGSGPNGNFIGKDFRSAYAPGTSLNGSGQSVGLLEFEGYYPADITAYEALAGIPNVPLSVVSVNGGITTVSTNNSEVALDIDMAISLAPGLSRVYVYEAPRGSSWLDLLSRMANDNLAKQLSCSWYIPGNSTVPGAETIFLQMAAQGQSFFAASGDSDALTGSIPFPGDSTNVIEVGGTTLTTTGPQGSYVTETVWNWGGGIGSSGGISTRYSIPYYQQGLSMASNLGSSTMRNTPDVALTADNIVVYADNGIATYLGGTSASAPLWAGFAALINQQAAANARPAVGFLNPAVYALGRTTNYAAAVHDTTIGDNTWSRSTNRFYAVPGYDLCTGWGTPTGTNLIYALAGAPGPAPASNSFTLTLEACTNGFIDPGETVTVNVGLKNIGGYSTTNLVATLLPSGGVIPLSGPQTYGALPAFGGNLALPFTFIATGTCGSSNTATLQLQDGTNSFWPASFTFQLGKSSSAAILVQNFDGVTAPALPSGWTSAATNAQSNWTTSTNNRDSGFNAAFSPAPSNQGVNELDSPSFTLPNAVEQLSFRHNYDLEAGYDGGVLEIKIGTAGNWIDIVDAGGSFITGGYVTNLDATSGNPLGGRAAWSGTTGGFITTLVTLPPAAGGKSIRLRWRCGTDTGTSGAGWYVDTVRLTSYTYACCSSAPTITVQPQGATVALGTPALLTVGAVGTYPLAYQWQLGGTNIPGATTTNYSLAPLPEGTNPVLTIVQAGFSQAGSYSVIVTNAYGAATSGPAILSVVDTIPPTILACPTNGILAAGANCQAALPDLTAQLAAIDASGPVSVIQIPPPGTLLGLGSTLIVFSVQDSSGNSSTCAVAVVIADLTPPAVLFCVTQVSLPLTTNCGYTLPDLTGTNFFLAVDSCSSTTVTQAPPVGAALTFGTNWVVVSAVDASGNVTHCSVPVVVPLDPVITDQPANIASSVGSTVAFSVTACGFGALAYAWQRDGTNLLGATNAVLTLTNLGPADAGSYQVWVTNLAAAATSQVASLTVLPVPPSPPVFQSISQAAGTITFVWSANPGSLYQLQSVPGLGQTNWVAVGNDVMATNTTASADDTVDLEPQRFYRVILLK